MTPNLSNHRYPHTSQHRVKRLYNITKLQEVSERSMEAADDTPNHAEHWPQTSQTILQSKSKWLVDSSFNLQKQQTKTSVVTPRRAKLTLVAIMFSNTLHARTWAAGKALILQKKLYNFDKSPSLCPLINFIILIIGILISYDYYYLLLLFMNINYDFIIIHIIIIFLILCI